MPWAAAWARRWRLPSRWAPRWPCPDSDWWWRDRLLRPSLERVPALPPAG